MYLFYFLPFVFCHFDLQLWWSPALPLQCIEQCLAVNVWLSFDAQEFGDKSCFCV